MRRLSRRGNYAILLALTLLTLLGFGALAVDVAWMYRVRAQCQDVADAASQAALIAFKRSGDTAVGEAAARSIAAKNPVGEGPASLEDITWGYWDHTAALPSLDPTARGINAVRVTVSRGEDDAVPLFLGRIFDRDEFSVRASASSAQRQLRVLLVMDVTGSWHEWHGSQVDFNYARTAAVNFLDVLTNAYGADDRAGMVIFTGRYAWEFTPFTLVSTMASSSAVRDAWSALSVASKGGNQRPYPTVCALKPLAQRNDFTSPAGGCYPNMPREYTDEPGTDHTTGLAMARQMFDEDPDPTVYRAMVVLTDGQPNGLFAGNGTIRASQGYVESRWREYMGPVPHTTAQIEADSVAAAADMWTELSVNTWVISFVQHRPFMEDMVQGDGYYSYTTDSAALVPIFERIARSLPLSVVE